MRALAVGLVGSAWLLLACPPPFYGLMRTGQIAAAPELSCVRDLLLQDDEISGLRIEDYGGGRRLTWRGLAPPDSAPTFIYTFGKHEYWLQFHIDQDRPVNVYHGARAEKEASASDLLGIHSHLVSLEARVEEQCAAPDLVASLEETCRAEHCDELEAHGA